MHIKAIDTIYNGYRFRSRLEARWAVFFDAMGIDYEYEREGYDLGKVGWYLPDFWLPKYELWVEIKPHTVGIAASQYDDAHKKAEALRDSTTYPVLLCYGNPKVVWNYLYACDTTDGSGGNYEGYATFADNFLLVHDTSSSREFYTTQWKPLNKIKTINGACAIYYGENYEFMDYRAAMEELEDKEFGQWIETGVGRSWDSARTARQARFEHGECN